MNKPYKIAVIDYRMSNMFSIKNALTVLGFDVEVTCDYSTILSCDGAILPGVGSFPEAMKNIKELNLDTAINDFIALGRPFLGICLGFQLLFDKSGEFEDTFGLGIISGEVNNLSKLNEEIRVPHVGWNNIKRKSSFDIKGASGALENINYQDYFYFVHSYYVKPSNDIDIFTTTEYSGIEFCSSIMKDNIFACQFHPEKSGVKGLALLKDFFLQRCRSHNG